MNKKEILHEISKHTAILSNVITLSGIILMPLASTDHVDATDPETTFKTAAIMFAVGLAVTLLALYLYCKTRSESLDDDSDDESYVSKNKKNDSKSIHSHFESFIKSKYPKPIYEDYRSPPYQAKDPEVDSSFCEDEYKEDKDEKSGPLSFNPSPYNK